ncbi:hypothetical protein [Paraburkholderia sp. D1E]|uniref:hypothetical protein n=1 Tax=Paraburkholderia sp. D1E TaxID=3461398 RepID=UPI004045F4AD
MNVSCIDHDVEAPGPAGRLSEENVQRVVIVQIESTNSCLPPAPSIVRATSCNRSALRPAMKDVTALAREAKRNRFTDSGRRAGNHRGFSKKGVHRLLQVIPRMNIIPIWSFG